MRKLQSANVAFSIVAFLFLFLILVRVTRSGSLEPPDDPGPTMHTLEQDLARLVVQRLITEEEAMNQANNKKRLRDLLVKKVTS